MKLASAVGSLLFLLAATLFAQQSPEALEPNAAALSTALHKITLDPAETYHVRELEVTRGDIKIYLTEGLLSFATEVDNRRVAAIFTTEGVELGDAEVLAFPPQPSERASLASFTKTPNLDEHFTAAIFVFSDTTASELLQQIRSREVHKASEVAAQLSPRLNSILEQVVAGVDVRVLESLLDHHAPANGFFYALIAGRQLPAFDIVYEPEDFEPVSIGRTSVANDREIFNLWTSFRPRHAPPYVPRPRRVTSYRLDSTIHAALDMSTKAAFDWRAEPADGRVVRLRMSDRLKVESASIDGTPAEIFQPQLTPLSDLKHGEAFLLISPTNLNPNTPHHVELTYSGTVVRQAANGSYAVDERHSWFPFTDPTLASFDFTFRCPARLRLVSTGELISEQVVGDERIVHRKTEVPEPLAGFNLGEYDATTQDRGEYHIECYANKSSEGETADIAKQTQTILDYYTRLWGKLPIHSVSVSPVPGYFGQGFPGLIYLSSMSYLREQDRPVALRNPQLDAFFSDLLLPHEVAHQWWGSIVTSANYRANWVLEAMANFSALQYVAESHGPSVVRAMLDEFRADLAIRENGKPIESAGPVDFGARLIDTAGVSTWHIVTYEKGTWILYMLLQRLGEEGFHKMQLRLLQQFAAKPITNEDFRQVASEFVPSGQPDKSLSVFFDTWVYGTGIPKMTLTRSKAGYTLTLANVDEDFTADVPLTCESRSGVRQVRWIHSTAGSNDVPLSATMRTCSLPPPGDFLYSF